jgi:glycosyltransferase involved in cell wall biosynthesis
VAAGVEAEKTHVLYNGVDLRAFRPRPATGYLHRELGLLPDAPLIATIGQIGLRKGQDVFIRAAIALADQLPRAHWLVVGGRSSEKAESRRFEADLHATIGGLQQFHFLGVRGDVDCILNELTMLAHPARQEPLGRVLLEAAASGLAVLATDVGGTSEIFPPESGAARLVPPDDSEALAGAIVELAGDAALRARLGAAARRRAEATFDASTATRRLLQHYAEVAAAG